MAVAYSCTHWRELRSGHWKEGKHDVLVLSGNSDYQSSVCQTALHDDDFGQNWIKKPTEYFRQNFLLGITSFMSYKSKALGLKTL